jgi:outer membrane protein TolC
LSDVLSGALTRSGTVGLAEADRDRSAGAVLGALGDFDPLYVLDVGTTRSRAQGFLDGGFPFESTSSRWGIEQGLTGQTRTGTSYDLSVGLSRSLSSSVTDLGAAETRTDNDSFLATAGVSVTQQLLEGIRFRYNVQNVTLARANLDIAELTVAKARQDTLYAAAAAYWTWAYESERHAITVEAVAVAEEALRVGKVQVERGQLAPVEATRLEAALVQARQDALDARNVAEAAANAVLLLIGEQPDQEVRPATAAGDVPVIEIDAERAVEVALAQNLDLELARRAVDAQEIVLDNAKHALLPTLAATIAAGVGSRRCPTPEGGGDNDCAPGDAMDAISGLLGAENQPYVEVGGLLTVPIGNRSARGERDQAGAQVARAQVELEQQQRLVAAMVEDQVRALQSARQRMELADANQRLADETLRAEEALATAGRTIQKNVLEARTELSRTRVEAAKARTDHRLAQAALLALQGQLTEE